MAHPRGRRTLQSAHDRSRRRDGAEDLGVAARALPAAARPAQRRGHARRRWNAAGVERAGSVEEALERFEMSNVSWSSAAPRSTPPRCHTRTSSCSPRSTSRSTATRSSPSGIGMRSWRSPARRGLRGTVRASRSSTAEPERPSTQRLIVWVSVAAGLVVLREEARRVVTHQASERGIPCRERARLWL